MFDVKKTKTKIFVVYRNFQKYESVKYVKIFKNNLRTYEKLDVNFNTFTYWSTFYQSIGVRMRSILRS